MPEAGVVRCAIYTRKSTEEGLEQEFNSLQAQREAAEAYIRSQREARWIALEEPYDDGGYTGANLERPAPQRLLEQARTRAVDCVVVYKVDRLSRSLLDFARLMALFEQCGVSFVSVTQEFNTTTSLGRLTLNILLSFAQFEREIISERTRDKLGAARRKGKWTGGIPILGYDVAVGGGQLVVNAAEAERVREIFAVAAAGESLEATQRELVRRGIHTKAWTSRSGRRHEAKPFSRSRLRSLLGNVLYIGSIRHKGKIYAGEQAAIVRQEVWEAVNRQLQIGGGPHTGRKRRRWKAMLAGVLFCGACGGEMEAKATTRRGRRYSYYVCGKGKAACGQASVSTLDMEAAVWRQVLSQGAACEHATEMVELIHRVTYDSVRRQVMVNLQDGSRREFELPNSSRGGARSGDVEGGRIPRVSRLMALAIKLEASGGSGLLRKQTEWARLGGISRARMSQILGLGNLSTAIQEQLLFLPKVTRGSDPVTEKNMRRIAQSIDWEEQEREFAGLLVGAAARGVG